MSYVFTILELLYDPERDRRILTNPSLSTLKGAMNRWKGTYGDFDARYIVHKGKIHVAAAYAKDHEDIAKEVSGEDSAHDGEAPSRGDDEPPGVLSLGAFEQDCGHYSVAEQDHHKGAHKFAQHWGTQHAQLSPRA